MYRRDILHGVTPRARDFDFLEELLIRLHAQGWRVFEVPFHYMARGSGRSHARLVKFGWALTRTLMRMWRLRNSVESADYDFRAFDSPIWLQRYWQRARHRIVTGWVGDEPIIDVGCGSSRIVADLPRALGIDIQYNKLRWLRARHDRLLQGSGDALPIRDSSVGTVITSEVIEHVLNSDEHIAEAARVLRPGGTLIIGTPDYDRPLWSALEWVYGKVLPGAYAHEHVTHYTRETLAASLERHQFDVVDCQYVGGCEMIFRAKRRGAVSARDSG
jgi:ubiquinone/menaquinone biosynthesis C-methylase UbiE